MGVNKTIKQTIKAHKAGTALSVETVRYIARYMDPKSHYATLTKQVEEMENALENLKEHMHTASTAESIQVGVVPLIRLRHRTPGGSE
jgi:hypothetical protein